ncbi:MAG: hypothetical protein WA824_10535 [Candidatus Sulfotelmatobacter sp.]
MLIADSAARTDEAGCASAGFRALPAKGGHTSGGDSISKIKKRPWAAEVEITAEDIKSSKISGNAGAENPEAYSLFVRLLKFCLHGLKLSSFADEEESFLPAKDAKESAKARQENHHSLDFPIISHCLPCSSLAV